MSKAHCQAKDCSKLLIREKKGYLKLSLVSCPIALYPATSEREKISFIALEARGKGMMGVTLRYPYEVRNEAEYFDDIPEEKVPKDMMDLALHIVETKRADFELDKFEDEYEGALKELIEKKAKGEKIERPTEPARSNVVNLMDALRESVEAETSRGSARRKVSPSPPRRAGKKPPADRKQKRAS
jgi:DNA end-binding protein Ku